MSALLFGEPLEKAEAERRQMELLGDFTEGEVKEVTPNGDGSGSFSYDSYVTGYPAGLGRELQVGDRIRVYGRFGSLVRGVAVREGDAWVPLWFRTSDVLKADQEKWLSDWERSLRKGYIHGGEARLDAEYEQLPAPLKRRMDRFRAADPDFRWKEESYEMAACAEAGRLYRRAMDPAFGALLKSRGVRGPKEGVLGVKSSWDWTEEDGTLDWEDTPLNRLYAFDAINSKLNGYNYKLMHELMPEMDDGHSGNTWGHAVVFAAALIRDGDNAQL